MLVGCAIAVKVASGPRLEPAWHKRLQKLRSTARTNLKAPGALDTVQLSSAVLLSVLTGVGSYR